MKTFIWSNDRKTEYHFFIAVASNIDEARAIIKKEIETNMQYEYDWVNESVEKRQEPINTEYQEEWITMIETENPVIIENGEGAVFSHSNA